MRKNNGVTQSLYTTLDAYQAGYLCLKGFVPTFIEEGPRKIVFGFNESENLFREIQNYHDGARVEAIRLAVSVKTLKSKIFSMKMEKERCTSDYTRSTTRT
jgi:hypothetical protein